MRRGASGGEAAAEAEEQDEKMCQLRYDLCAMLGDEGIEAHRAAAAAAADAAPTERPNSEQAHRRAAPRWGSVTNSESQDSPYSSQS